DDDGALDDSLEVEDRDLRLIDDGCGDERAEAAGVGDRERATAHVVGAELAGARAARELRDPPCEALGSKLVRVADHWHDQPVAPERDGDAEVDRAMQRELLALERRDRKSVV